MKHADHPVRAVLSPVVQQQIQQYAAVLSAAKGYVNIVKLPKQKFEPFLQRIIHVHFQILFFHIFVISLRLAAFFAALRHRYRTIIPYFSRRAKRRTEKALRYIYN